MQRDPIQALKGAIPPFKEAVLPIMEAVLTNTLAGVVENRRGRDPVELIGVHGDTAEPVLCACMVVVRSAAVST
eukprot:1341897-Rhodomonas_salina.2